jgi:futalosine hydrolase
MILVVCALGTELRFWTPRPNVEVLAGGVGPVEAAIATARRLADGGCDAVVNAGIAGAFRGRARVGDALVIARETLADLGLEGGLPLALPEGTLVERADADAALVGRCADLPYRAGSGITVAQVTTTAATGERLAARYGADVESMEGFSVLRAAALAGIPALEVRGISNLVGDRAQSEWDFVAGAKATAAVLDAVLDALAA